MLFLSLANKAWETWNAFNGLGKFYYAKPKITIRFLKSEKVLIVIIYLGEQELIFIYQELNISFSGEKNALGIHYTQKVLTNNMFYQFKLKIPLRNK